MPTAARPSTVASAPCWWIAQSNVSAPRKSSRGTMSPVPLPPACGPAAVATVPAKSTMPPNATRPRIAQRVSLSAAGGRVSGS